jgi:hypothetical protein
LAFAPVLARAWPTLPACARAWSGALGLAGALALGPAGALTAGLAGALALGLAGALALGRARSGEPALELAWSDARTGGQTWSIALAFVLAWPAEPTCVRA